MKKEFLFFVFGAVISALLLVGYNYLIANPSSYDVQTVSKDEHKSPLGMIYLEGEPIKFAINDMLLQEIWNSKKTFKDCHVRMGFRDLERLYVYIRWDNSINDMNSIIEIEKIKQIFKQQFKAYPTIFLTDFNTRPWKSDTKPYAIVTINFTKFDRDRFVVNSSTEILTARISYKRSDNDHYLATENYPVPITRDQKALAEWFKERVVGNFARYYASYQTYNCI